MLNITKTRGLPRLNLWSAVPYLVLSAALSAPILLFMTLPPSASRMDALVTPGTLVVQNLHATGNITLDTATASTLASFDASKHLSTFAGASGTLCLHGDSTWGSCGTTSTPSVAVANSAGATGTKSLSSEGTIDWVGSNAITQTTNNWNHLSSGTTHSKLNGQWLFNFCSTFNNVSNTSASYGATFTSTAADDSSNSALSSTTMNALFASSVGTVGFGFHCQGFPIPPGVTRVFRLYVSVFNCTITTGATLSISGTTSTQNFTIGSSQTDKTVTITATGGTAGDEIYFDTRCTTNPGSNGSYSIAAITVAPT